MSFLLPLTIVLFFTAPTEKVVDVVIQPVDINWQGHKPIAFGALRQIETDGRYLYLRTDGGDIVRLDGMGRFVDVPARVELKQNEAIYGMSVHENQIGLLLKDGSFHVFENGEYQRQIVFEQFGIRDIFPNYNANVFHLFETQIALPAATETGKMFHVYNAEGKMIKSVGRAYSLDGESPWRTEFLNSSAWIKADKTWYALSKFQPVIYKFDEDFNQIGMLELEGSEIFQMQDMLLFATPDEADAFRNIMMPFFYDFQYYRGDLFFTSAGVLYQVDGSTGILKKRYRFFGKGEDFKNVPGDKQVKLHSFAILDSGKIVLSHPALLWNHELWTFDFQP